MLDSPANWTAVLIDGKNIEVYAGGFVGLSFKYRVAFNNKIIKDI